MPLEGQGFLAGLCIPDLHGLVPAAAYEPLAIRAEGRAQHPAGVSPERKRLLAGRGVPYFQCLIKAAADKGPAIPAEGHATDRTTVAPEHVLRLPRPRI